MNEALVRLFVRPEAVSAGELALTGADAERLFLRGARAGDTVIVLDDSGWRMSVELREASLSACAGVVVERSIAPERRTKISLYQGLLHPSDFRRLLVRATAAGVIEFVPVITDGSIVPSLGVDGSPEGASEWPHLVRDAAEKGGRGRLPGLRPPMLLDHALDETVRRGTVLMVDPGGDLLESHLSGRPFSIDVLCPPPAGFSAHELSRARAADVDIVRAPYRGPDPIQPALSTVVAIYESLESEEASA